MTRPARPPDSRGRILAAAATEFAARGFDGANLDRIARAARLNKAMIYYHFRNKAALYGEIFRRFIEAVLARVRAIVAADASPREKISAFITAIVTEAELRPHFPPMWLREIAGGGRHLDRTTLDLVRQIPQVLGTIMDQGTKTGEFRRGHPLLMHLSIVGPLVLYYASQAVRSRMAGEGLTNLMVVPRDQLVAHVEHATLATLTAGPQDKGRRS